MARLADSERFTVFYTHNGKARAFVEGVSAAEAARDLDNLTRRGIKAAAVPASDVEAVNGWRFLIKPTPVKPAPVTPKKAPKKPRKKTKKKGKRSHD